MINTIKINMLFFTVSAGTGILAALLWKFVI